MTYRMIYTREDEAWSPQMGFNQADHDEGCTEVEVQELRREYSAKDIKVVKFTRVPSNKQVQASTDKRNGKA